MRSKKIAEAIRPEIKLNDSLAINLNSKTFEGLHRIAVGGVGRGKSVAAEKRADCCEQKLEVLKWVVALHGLVQITVEGHPLHIVGAAHLDEGLASSI